MSLVDVLLPTTTVGSYAVPGWLQATREMIRRGEFGRLDVREVLDDAVMAAITDQERAGLDILSDGEERRHDFIMGFYERIHGFRPMERPRKIGVEFYDTEVVYEAIDRIAAPAGLGIVEEFLFARTRTTRPLKVPVPGPLTLTTPTRRGPAYKTEETYVGDLARIVHTELQRLAEAGATFIQIDEPAFHPWFTQNIKGVVQLFNEAVRGVKAKIALHICFGNRAGRPRSRRSYVPFFPAVLEARAEQFVLEFANREMAEIDLWARFGVDRELGAGLIDQKSFYLETPEDVAGRIRMALKHVPPEKLYINPDCGMNYTPRWLAFRKLKAMVDGTQIVRGELGGGRTIEGQATPGSRGGGSGRARGARSARLRR
ncbi:MAG: methionine synthase [Deltaproteobacteria bacterium]|nr:methionine synthase [Deltaproteobacteria bacterium]